MGWVKLDDGFWLSEKANSVSAEAHRLYTRSLSFAGQNLTDGAITAHSLGILEPDKRKREKLTAELVAAKLWESGDGRWVIHDYLVYNESRGEREQKREEWRLAGKRGAAKRWGDPIADPMANPIADPIATPIAKAMADPNRTPNSRIDKIREEKKRPDEIAQARDDGQDSLLLDYGATFKAAESWLGFEPKGMDLERLSSAIEDYGEPRVRHAIQVARDNGKRDMSYMLTVCRNTAEVPLARVNPSSNGVSVSSSGTGFSPKDPNYRGPDMAALLGGDRA